MPGARTPQTINLSENDGKVLQMHPKGMARPLLAENHD
jgi:hypothetical protein